MRRTASLLVLAAAAAASVATSESASITLEAEDELVLELGPGDSATWIVTLASPNVQWFEEAGYYEGQLEITGDLAAEGATVELDLYSGGEDADDYQIIDGSGEVHLLSHHLGGSCNAEVCTWVHRLVVLHDGGEGVVSGTLALRGLAILDDPALVAEDGELHIDVQPVE